MEDTTQPTRGVSRRTLVKGAAWSVPVIAVAAATPLAAASTAGATVTWGPNSGPVLALGVLNPAATGGSLANVSVLPNGPQYFSVNNLTPGAITGPLTGTVAITYNNGLAVGSVKGYGVFQVAGDANAVSGRAETSRGVNIVLGNPLGTVHETSQNIVVSNPSIAGSTSVNVPITFGLTDSGLLGLGVLITYNVTVTLYDANNAQIGQPATTTIQLPANLSIL